MSLFGSSSSRNQSKNLVEFRAGKMTVRGNMVHPDKRKGLVYIYQSSDSLIHFCWKDRQTGEVEDDWIVFPDDCEYIRVPQCTTGRVYLLKFKSSNKKTFFWMQEPKTDKDDTYCRKVNEYLNNPPTPGSQGGRGGSERDLQSLLSSMSQQQLMQLFGNVGGMPGLSSLLVPSETPMRGSSGSRSRSSGATSGSSSQNRSAAAAAAAAPPAVSSAPAPAVPSTPSTGGNATGANLPATPLTTGVPSLGNLTNLQQILSGIQVPESALGLGGAPQAEKPSVDLSEGLSSDVLHPILSNPEFMRQLRDFLPPTDQADRDTPAMVRDTVQSPQFVQALSVFSAALQSGQLGPLIQQFGLGPDAVDAAQRGDMEAFIKALQQNKDKKDEGDDGMALD